MSRLIKKAKTDQHAFSKLYREYIKPVYSFVFSRVQNAEESEDITSTIWETVLKNISNLRTNNESAFRVWLYKIARNTFYAHLEKNKNYKNSDLEEAANEIPDQSKNPHEHMEVKENIQHVKTLINDLPKKLMTFFEKPFTASLKPSYILHFMVSFPVKQAIGMFLFLK